MIYVRIDRATDLRPVPPASEFGFGRYFTDHMFIADFDRERGWHSPRVVPFGSIQLSPVSASLQYGQALFEGMKAFRGTDGRVRIFRPDFHGRRLRQGARRLCMPDVPQELFEAGLNALLNTDDRWILGEPGASLYLRPTLIATEAFLGMRPADSYRFLIPASPAAAYFKGGPAPLKIWIEQEQTRAAVGGLGAVKASANYCASLQATSQARIRGYDQVLWLDGATKKLIEEVGTMNVFFRFENEIVTPPLEGTILGGATRDSIIQILRSWDEPITERRISLSEIFKNQSRLLESFGTGTAATVSSIGEFRAGAEWIHISAVDDSLASRLKTALAEIQYGEVPDRFGWCTSLI